jgi:hypothetical protein
MATDVNLGMLSLEELRRLLGSGQASPSSQMAGVSPYQQIMSRMPLLQNPYAGMSGGYNNFQGGYNPNLYSSAPRAIGQLGFGGGGGGGGSGGFNAAPSAWDGMTNAEKAAYYAENPTMASITQLGQKAFGYTGLGRLQAMMDPNLVTEQSLIAMGVNPAAYQSAKESFRASEIAAMNAGYPSAIAQAENNVAAGLAAAADAEAAAAEANAAANASAGLAAAQDAQDAAQASQDAANDAGASAAESAGPSGAGTESGGDGWAKGGKVTKDRLKGPDPKGPDEGYGALLGGEYVIKKSAVNKYGTGLLDMINNGKIPAKKMKSLLG